ncbi:MAG: hypothetical protein ACR2HM_01200 [Acidimicrobiales bacterium]
MRAVTLTWSWLYRRCLLWGLATGADAGAATGAFVSASPYLGPASAFSGAIATYSDAGGLIVLLVGDAGGLPMLWWGRARISTVWANAPG